MALLFGKHDKISTPEGNFMFDRQRTSQRACQRTGFTLIELLVVIALVAILAAMLLPTLSKSKGEAYSAICKNNLHQMGIALHMYADEYKVYPYYAETQVSQGLMWEQAVGIYYPVVWFTNRNYYCPSYTGQVLLPGPLNNVVLQADGNNGSYAYNAYGTALQGENLGLGLGVGVSGEVPNIRPHRESDIVAPGELFAIMDSEGGMEGSETPPYTGFKWTGADVAGCGLGLTLQTPPQHGKYFNVLSPDVHVAQVPLTTLFDPTKSARNWSVDNKPHPELWDAR